jgi:GNAT superfamily N-acetyltransferase
MIKIRGARESDTPQLERLFLIARQKTFVWENPEKFKLEDYRESVTGETVFVAEDESGTIVGFISVWELGRPPFIHHLYVAPNHQGEGIGQLLIGSLFSWLPTPYELKCLVKNKRALAFYQKNNWVVVGEGSSEDGEYLLLELP